MKPVTIVNLGNRSYPVIVGKGLIDRIRNVIEEYSRDVSSITLVTSPIIDRLYGERAAQALESESKILIPDGEGAKTWDIASQIIGSLLDKGVDRKGLMITLGGGAVGDVAGFAASIYFRGIRVIHIPTTLLAMVDSSIGGKTAVNHQKGKNLVGSFHQPTAVIVDPSLLKSLPQVEIKAGLGEIIKYGVIADEKILEIFEDNLNKILSGELEALSELIERSAIIKARYVEKDEFDLLGIRAALNYGHTLGHAIERLTSIRHGEAVAIGMEHAARVAVKKGIFKQKDLHRQRKITHNLGLPTDVPELSPITLLDIMRRDKKAEGGRIRLVMPTGLGKEPVLEVVSAEEIISVLEDG